MRIIHKYQIAIARLNVIEVPEGAQLLHVAMQVGALTLWYMVDPQAIREQKKIVVVGTGEGIHSRPDSLAHLGTVLTADGQLVWHVFEQQQFEMGVEG